MNSRASTVVGGVLAVMSAGSVMAVPKDSVRTTSWQLDVKFHDVQRLTLRLLGDRQETTFWYLLYEVTNHTGLDRHFYPSFRLVTDTLQVVEGGANVSPTVYDVILGRHKAESPFLALPTKVTGLLLQGQANARASVVVFRDFDEEANGFSIYLSGFSGEMRRNPNPTFNPKQAESQQNRPYFLLRRTLAIRYDFPGDPQTRHRATPIRRTRDWVMR